MATAPKCADDLQKKAAFLEVRLAAVSKGAAAEPLAQAFIRRFGKDPLVDDVWLWLAEVRSARGDDDAAMDALSTLVNEHPHGDMVNACTLKVYVQFSGDSFSYRDNLNIYKEKKSKLINRTNSFNTLKAQHG